MGNNPWFILEITMSCRALLGSIALFGALHVPSYGQDLLPKEILIVDQGCIERKVIQCLAIGVDFYFYTNKIKCGEGGAKQKNKNNCLFTSPNVFIRNNIASKISNAHTTDLTFEEAQLFTRTRDLLISQIPRIEQCRAIVEAFPSAYGTENCLKPLAEERILNALTIELRDLVKQLCHRSGDPECVDDEVPVEAASPDTPPPDTSQTPG